MERFFWIRVLGREEITIGSLADDGRWDVIGLDEGFHPSEVIVGSEIHASKTGLLSALNEVK